MRKIFASLKAVVAAALVASMTLAASCSYDDSAINNRVDKVEEELAALTERVKALESHAEAVKELLDGALVVTNVETKDGVTTVTLSDGTKITVYGECDTLQYRVEEGVLEVSADGQNWVAVEQTADCVIKAVVVNEDNTVTFTLADDTEFTVALAELIECEAARTGVYVLPGETKEIVFTVNDAVVDMNIMNQPFGWSATVGEPTVEEENGGIAPFAAGGTDYALKITGPSEELIAAGYAAKEGVVSVHFNTASGACKVLSVNVNLAEITFDIDKAGNITITNSVVEQKGNFMIGYHDGFANFYIGVVYKSDLDDMGSLQGIVNYGLPMALNQHDNLSALFNQQYEVGVCEKEVATFTIEELFEEYKSSASANDVTLEAGQEYVVFIAMTSYGEADFNNVVALDYKALNVKAEKVEGSETWNGADYKFTIMGYDVAVIGYVEQAQVDGMMEGGLCTDLDSFYDFYIASAENVSFPLIGSPVELAMGPWENVLITASELSQFYTPIKPNTEYRLYALCFNMADLMSGKEFTHDDIYDFGTFTTTSLEAGDFDVITGSQLEAWESSSIDAYVYLSDDVYLSYFKVFDEPAVDVESRINEMLESAYFEENSELHVYEFVGDAESVCVGVIATNDKGQYAYEEIVINKNSEGGEGNEGGEGGEGGDEPAEVTVVSASATHGNVNGDMNYHVVNFTLSNGVVYAIDMRTNGNPYLPVGEYTTDWSTYNSGQAAGYIYVCSKIEDGNKEDANCTGATVSYADDKYTVVFNIYNYDTYALETYTYVGAIEGLEEPVIEEGGEVVIPDTENLKLKISDKEFFGWQNNGSYSQIRFVDENDKNFIFFEINDGALYNHTYVHDGNVNGDSTTPGTLYNTSMYVCYDGAYSNDNTHMTTGVTGGTVKVEVDGDNCTMTLDLTLANGKKYTGVYSGPNKLL